MGNFKDLHGCNAVLEAIATPILDYELDID